MPTRSATDILKSLIADAAAMRCTRPDECDGDDNSFFGPFSEGANIADGFESPGNEFVIEWPNLAIEIEEAEKAIAENIELQHAEAAMCAWEWYMDNAHDGDYETAREAAGGYSGARMAILDLATPLHNAWAALPENVRDYGPFDWEYVPFVMGRLANPLTATAEEVNAAAKAYEADVKNQPHF